jgi:hypothetical protein
MPEQIEIEIFRAGNYGDKGNFTADDIQQIASDYNPSLHEAPVTVDHSQSGPAFGWVGALKQVGNKLVARLKDLNDGFRDLITKGAFKKPSVELYRKFSATGKPYLRALSFLGAKPPEVKSLAPVAFSDNSDYLTVNLPDDEQPQRSEQFNEISPEVAKICEQKEHLERQLSEIKARNSRADIALFCEEAKRTGRFLPAWEKLGIIDFILSLDNSEPVSFAEGAQKQTPLEWFKSFLRSLPPMVPLKEIAADPKKIGTQLPNIPSESERAPVSTASIELHRKVLIFQEQNPGTIYADALRQIAR